jgi:hypothetical protein
MDDGRWPRWRVWVFGIRLHHYVLGVGFVVGGGALIYDDREDMREAVDRIFARRQRPECEARIR